MLPLCAFSSPEIARNVVDFPAPFAPINVTMSPLPTRNETSCSAVIDP